MRRYIYIAGPMRGREDFNFPAFARAKAQLELQYPDAVVFSPAARDLEQYGRGAFISDTGDLADAPHDFSLREALGFDLDWIARQCTHLYLLAGWSGSRGAIAERALAIALGLEIDYENWEETLTGPEIEAWNEGYEVGVAEAYGSLTWV